MMAHPAPSSTPADVQLLVTGFGSFTGVATNPTQALIEYLHEQIELLTSMPVQIGEAIGSGTFAAAPALPAVTVSNDEDGVSVAVTSTPQPPAPVLSIPPDTAAVLRSIHSLHVLRVSAQASDAWIGSQLQPRLLHPQQQQQQQATLLAAVGSTTAAELQAHEGSALAIATAGAPTAAAPQASIQGLWAGHASALATAISMCATSGAGASHRSYTGQLQKLALDSSRPTAATSIDAAAAAAPLAPRHPAAAPSAASYPSLAWVPSPPAPLLRLPSWPLPSPPRRIVLHLGVASSATCFRLERCAYNDADFRCADEDGWQPAQQPIDPAHSLGAPACTGLDLVPLLHALTAGGFDVCVSTDPGRFCCNYLYWRSLAAVAAAWPWERCADVLFVHVPPFEAVPEAVQRRFVLALLVALAGCS